MRYMGCLHGYLTLLKMKRDLEKVKALLQSLCMISSHVWAFLLGKTLAKMLNQYSHMQGKEMRFHERRDLLQ